MRHVWGIGGVLTATAMALLAWSATARAAADPWIMAEGCAGCHPAKAQASAGASVLAGRPVNEIADNMRAFRSGAQSGTIMNRIAKGFSDDEIAAVARILAASGRK